MFVATTVLVAFGILGAVLLALGLGFDVVAGIILSLIVLVGGTAIAASRKARLDRVGPMSCPECGGLLSPHAPICKHCGALIGSDRKLPG